MLLKVNEENISAEVLLGKKMHYLGLSENIQNLATQLLNWYQGCPFPTAPLGVAVYQH